MNNHDRIHDQDLARKMANAEDKGQTTASKLKEEMIGLRGLRNVRKRAALKKDIKWHLDFAAAAGQTAKEQYEERQAVLDINRNEYVGTIKDKLGELAPEFRDSADSGSKYGIDWSTDPGTSKQTLVLRDAESLEYGMWMDKKLVVTDGEDPQLFTRFTDELVFKPEQSREYHPATHDVDYKINQTLINIDEFLDRSLASKNNPSPVEAAY